MQVSIRYPCLFPPDSNNDVLCYMETEEMEAVMVDEIFLGVFLLQDMGGDASNPDVPDSTPDGHIDVQ